MKAKAIYFGFLGFLCSFELSQFSVRQIFACLTFHSESDPSLCILATFYNFPLATLVTLAQFSIG